MQGKYVVFILSLWTIFGLLLIFLLVSEDNDYIRANPIVIRTINNYSGDQYGPEIESELNYEQIIYIRHQYGPDIDLVIVIQVHNRLVYLQELIKSLSESSQIEKTLIIFSHDVEDAAIFEKIQEIQFANFMQILYPFSLQKHPNKFPGPDSKDCKPSEPPKSDCPNINYTDTYGHFRDADAVQIKHHWWWKINFVFDRADILKNYDGLVLLLEEDHYVSPDFIHSLKMMERYAKQACSDCWFYALGLELFQYSPNLGYNVVIRDSVENRGLAFNRTIWRQIRKYSKQFCDYDDYNWDWSLRHIVNDFIKPKPASIIMADEKLWHIGFCGTHVKQEKCDPKVAIGEFKKRQLNLFPAEVKAVRQNFAYTIKNNGGWGDPRDQALCTNMSQVVAKIL